ncbi:MAG TPA: polyprenyl synthetase family protein, partial [Salinimicrobium sp.]|nr:polyprenyl synthetase family protein [Salinimicrobium sp.]
IIENKKTFLYLKTLEMSDKNEATQLEHLYSINPYDTSGKIESVKALFEYSGAADLTRKEIEKYTKKAFEICDQLEIEEDKKAILRSFGQNLMEREV